MSRKYRVLIVDDSPLFRRMLSDHLGAHPELEVVGTAEDGEQALTMVNSLNPDVITLDVQMPKMDGLATVEAVLRIRPIPAIMVSATTTLGAQITLQALERGAVDYITKPTRLDSQFANELIRKVLIAVGTDVERMMRIRRERQARMTQRSTPQVHLEPVSQEVIEQFNDKLVAIGISTGGPPALTHLFESLRPPMPPIVIVQHMPPHFTKALASRLDGLTPLSVKEAESGDILKPNCVYIAPGGFHLGMSRHGRVGKLAVQDGDIISGHKPSVDHMMRAAVGVYGNRILGVIMTGMGRDGSLGCGMIRAAGGYVLGQDDATSDVYGMNKVAFQEGNVDKQFGLPDGAGAITRQVRTMWAPQLAAR